MVVTFEGSEQLKMLFHGEVGVQDVVLRAHAEVLTNVRHLFIDVHAERGVEGDVEGMLEVVKGVSSGELIGALSFGICMSLFMVRG